MALLDPTLPLGLLLLLVSLLINHVFEVLLAQHCISLLPCHSETVLGNS